MGGAIADGQEKLNTLYMENIVKSCKFIKKLLKSPDLFVVPSHFLLIPSLHINNLLEEYL